MREFVCDRMQVSVADTDGELGAAAAEQFATAVRAALRQRADTAVVLALGAAQQVFFGALRTRHDIEWARITVLQVDTYLGIGEDRPESGAYRLRKQLLDDVKPKAFIAMQGDHEPVEEELARYTRAIQELNPTVCVVGIGDTGHLAFNDPPADFETRELVRVVPLSEVTRRQVARAGTFPTPEEVPQFGISLTMHALLQPSKVIALVHQQEKSSIIKQVVEGPVTPACPASLLQQHANAHLYLTEASASLLSNP